MCEGEKRVLVVFGTRPEAIKMAPVVKELEGAPLDFAVCVTAQQREMLDQVLALFQIEPDYDLDVMQQDQSLSALSVSILEGLQRVIADYKPALILVHGDTATCAMSSLAAFYNRVPIAHVEAGLRTYDLASPWPEEFNRQLVGRIAELNFAPTKHAADNLISEGVSREQVFVTGNTVIDALHLCLDALELNEHIRVDAQKAIPSLCDVRKVILITGHRRENFGGGFEEICAAIAELANREDLHFVYPVHLNPNVKQPVMEYLGGLENVSLIDPLDYASFVLLMKHSFAILTDSGGIQEEAPALGKPVLLMRDNTERPEAVEGGTVRLVGANRESIVEGVINLVDNSADYKAMASAINPYGDGTAAEKIVEVVVEWLGKC